MLPVWAPIPHRYTRLHTYMATQKSRSFLLSIYAERKARCACLLKEDPAKPYIEAELYRNDLSDSLNVAIIRIPQSFKDVNKVSSHLNIANNRDNNIVN